MGNLRTDHHLPEAATSQPKASICVASCGSVDFAIPHRRLARISPFYITSPHHPTHSPVRSSPGNGRSSLPFLSLITFLAREGRLSRDATRRTSTCQTLDPCRDTGVINGTFAVDPLAVETHECRLTHSCAVNAVRLEVLRSTVPTPSSSQDYH